VHHQYALRQQLIQLDLYLQDEILLMENQRFYEVLRVSSTKSNVSSKISPVGSLLWRCNTDQQLNIAIDYLSKTIAHYKRMQQHSGFNVQNIIDAYSALVSLIQRSSENKP
jgi:tRNA (adenine22-N1)-methyltransferase